PSPSGSPSGASGSRGSRSFEMSEREPGGGPSGGPAVEDNEVNVFDHALVLWRHRWLIVALCMATAIATFGYTVTRPKVYEATATVIAPKEGGGSGLLGGLVTAGLLQQ